MYERGVSEAEVEIVLEKPDHVEPSVKGRINTFKYLGGRYIRVTFTAEADNSLIITVAVRNRPFRKVLP